MHMIARIANTHCYGFEQTFTKLDEKLIKIMHREIVIYENIRLACLLDWTADFGVKTKLVDFKHPPLKKMSIDSPWVYKEFTKHTGVLNYKYYYFNYCLFGPHPLEIVLNTPLYAIYRLFIKYCVFLEDFKIFLTLAFLCFPSVSACVQTPGR